MTAVIADAGVDAAEAALRVAFLEAVLEAAKEMYEQERADAEAVFALLRAKGNPQQEVQLGGVKIGLISIAGEDVKVTAVDEGKLLAWARENLPDAIEQYIDPMRVANREVIEMVRDCFPGSVRERIRPETRKALVERMKKNDGFLGDKETGEGKQIGVVKKTPADGSFTLNGVGKEARRAAIIAAWQRGDLPASVTGGLTLPPRALSAITVAGEAG
jgi:hypothetical protein